MPPPYSRRPTRSRTASPGVGESFAAYSEYNKILRAWFVAFGVGGPALFLIHPEISKELAKRHELQWVAGLFLAGAGLQVVCALINKIVNWFVYYGSENYPDSRKPWWLTVSYWFSCQFWIDVVLDVLTIGVFGRATWLLFNVFGS